MAPRRPIDRRSFLGLVVAGVAAACSTGDDRSAPAGTAGPGGTLSSPGTVPGPAPEFSSTPFTLGVASGDPTPEAVILWTRLAPEPLHPEGTGGLDEGDIAVSWEIAEEETFGEPVASGTVLARSAFGHAVHVDATGLQPDRWYWYRFRVGEHESPIGRTRTLPAAGSSPSSLRFAFGSCQNYQSGYWPAYGHLAEEDLDLVFFLGDYIYEGRANPDALRQHDGDEATDLAGYRNRHALYKSDPRLTAAHARFPWVVTWDDHEVDNNYAGDLSENGDPRDEFLARRAAGYQAYYEHLPLRVDPPDGPDLRIYRGFAWGDLADVFVLDTRQYRSPQVCDDGGSLPVQADCADASSAERTILGSAQRAWLLDGLRTSDARWAVLANQVVMGPIPVGDLYNMDQWDGYRADRAALLEAMADSAASPVVITGDIHLSGVAALHLDPEDVDSPPVAAELVGTSISSTFAAELEPLVEAIGGALPWVRYLNARQRGYVTVELTPDQATARYRLVETALEPDSPIATDATFVIRPDDSPTPEVA